VISEDLHDNQTQPLTPLLLFRCHLPWPRTYVYIYLPNLSGSFWALRGTETRPWIRVFRFCWLMLLAHSIRY